MKTLHLLKTEPDDGTRRLIAALSEGGEAEEAVLYREPVDYEKLVEKVFASDRVLSWW